MFVSNLVLLQFQLAAFEPAPILALLFFIAWQITVQLVRTHFQKANRAEDEERMELKLAQIQGVMRHADAILRSHMTYYSELSERGREKFLARLQVILASKQFYAKEGLKLTPEVQVLTAGAIVQITFGLRSFRLERFQKIVVYPDVFYNRLLDRDLKGSTSPNGVLRFSWKHLAHGYAVGDDNVNLALHESAHALKVVVDEENSYLDTHLDGELADFLESGTDIRNAILEGKLTLIRKYASTNEHEFFACCVEYFFESPGHFKQNLPRLYDRLVRILRQDPLRTEFDYRPSDIVVETQRDANGRIVFGTVKREVIDDDAFAWLPNALAIGIFAGWPLSLFFHFQLESTLLSVVLFDLTVVVLGVLAFGRKMLLSGYTTLQTFALFIIAAWVPLVSSGALAVNQLIPIYTYQVVEPVTYHHFGKRMYLSNPESVLRHVREGIDLELEEVLMYRGADKRLTLHSEVYYGVLGLRVYGDYTCDVAVVKMPEQ
jgi:Mlc titration factor MtfA (ptsG expression regulator)